MGYDDVVALLLSNGADVNQADNDGSSPLLHTDPSIALVSTNDVFLPISILTPLIPSLILYIVYHLVPTEQRPVPPLHCCCEGP